MGVSVVQLLRNESIEVHVQSPEANVTVSMPVIYNASAAAVTILNGNETQAFDVTDGLALMSM
eukprot:1935355-Amphidinium_carterae.2